jgi:hypothetical protein
MGGCWVCRVMGWSNPGGDEMAESSVRSVGRFWPWGPGSAVAATGLLLVLLLGTVAVLRIAADWPHERWEAALLVGAALVSFLPIALVVLGSVAESQGSVSFRGLSLTFGTAVREVAAVASRAAMSVPRNVAHEGVNVGDSGNTEVLKVMRDVTNAEVVVVDLEDGHAWWDSRLLLLCVGCASHGRPKAVVFVGTVNGTRRVFVGWASPSDIVAAILRADRQLAYAHAVAQAYVRQAELSFPGRAPVGDVPVPTTVVHASIPPGQPTVWPDRLFERHGEVTLLRQPADALVRALGETVTPLEEEGGVAHLSVVRVHELLDPVLHIASIAESASDEEWVEAALAFESDYLAVTDADVYRGLMRRSQLVGALLRAVFATIDAVRNHEDGRPPYGEVAEPTTPVP